MDNLGKEFNSLRPNTRGISMDFQKLHEFRKSISEKNTNEGQSTIKSALKTPRVRSEELVDWVDANESNVSPEKKIISQNKQIENSEFVCDGLGDFTGFHRKANEPTGTVKIESDESVKLIALVHEVPPKRRNLRHSLDSKFQLSGLSATPLDEEVTLHPEGDNFSADCTPTKRCGATCDTHKKVQPSQELLDLKKELEEKNCTGEICDSKLPGTVGN